MLVPGHGPAIFGADRVATLLADGAKFLDTMHDQVLALMNEGKTLDEIVQAVKIPTDLLTRPYLQPTYDDPEFLIRNIWRLYGGWWDGDPAHLKPAPASPSPPNSRSSPAAHRNSPRAPRNSPPAATSASPATSPNSPSAPSRRTRTPTAPASRSTSSAPPARRR